jgi:hypothetical protein
VYRSTPFLSTYTRFIDLAWLNVACAQNNVIAMKKKPGKNFMQQEN